MGYLLIKLLEARNLEPKDHSGTSDPIVTCKLLSNETQQSIAKAKSKVVKKTCNPIFNETLTLPVSNNPRGHTLHIVVQDWNRIGSKQPLGDCSINLDDWKPSEERDLWLNLQNTTTGTVHVQIGHKADNKSKVLISYGSEALVEYNLLRSVKLNTQLDLLCQLFSTPNPCEQYTLQIKDTEQFITQEQLSDAKFEIPDNTVLRLMLRPNLQVDVVLQSLKAESSQKKAIFDLKTQLQDSAFAEAFIAKDGIRAITKLITDTQGNTLAYALSALDSCMTFGMGWDTLNQQEIEKIVSLLDSQNLNVRSGALKVASQLASSKNFGYPLLNAAIKKLKNNLFGGLMSTFPTSDVLIQLSSLQFVNSMLHSAPPQEKQHLFELLEKEKMTQLLKDQVNTSDPELKSQIARYAKLKFELDKAPTTYDKENPEHEKMLMDLWTTLYPDQKLEARVCKQWKLLGFQGNDPATDFRGMGTLALKHLLYAAKNYTEDIRNMMQEQEENPDTYYPVAVAGINLSKMLYDIFRDAENDSDLKYIPLLFDHEHSLDEIYCECLFFFDETWTEMEATYFNFSNVIAIVADRIVDTLSQCKKLQEFRDKCSGSKNAEKGNNKKSKDKKDKKKTTPFFKKLGGVMSPKPNEKNVSNKKTESIHTVVKEGNTKKASDLIREGTNINELNESGQSALHVAVINGNLDMVRLLLWKDAEVDIKNPAGWTPLHEAAKNSSLEICDVLLHKGANPSAETSDGITPFHYLVGRRFVDNNLHQEVMTDMLNKGININHSNNSNSETPLFYAVAKGLTDVARFLISHGADPNVKNKRGYTVLHIAIMQGEKAMVEVLLQSGADVTIPAKEGTPAELAKSNPQVLETINSYINNKGKPQNPAQQVATKAVNKPLPIPGKKVLPPLPANHPRARPASTKLPEKGSSNGNQVSCFHGDISREQAEALVVAQNKDCFLLRTSSVRGCYAMTVYKPGALELTHFLVYPRSTGGFSIQDCDDTNSYPNLNELITKSPVLKGCFPIPSPKPQPTQQQVPTKVSVVPAPGGESIYGMPPPSNEILKNQMNDLQKLLEASLIDVEKPAEWNKTKVNLKKSLNGLAGLLN